MLCATFSFFLCEAAFLMSELPLLMCMTPTAFLIPKHPNLMYVTSIFLFLMSLSSFSHSITSDLFFYKPSEYPFPVFDAINIVYWTRNPEPVYKYQNNDASDINYRFYTCFSAVPDLDLYGFLTTHKDYIFIRELFSVDFALFSNNKTACFSFNSGVSDITFRLIIFRKTSEKIDFSYIFLTFLFLKIGVNYLKAEHLLKWKYPLFYIAFIHFFAAYCL